MKKGFTLADLLILVGILGVVASITLPTIVKEFNAQFQEPHQHYDFNFTHTGE